MFGKMMDVVDDEYVQYVMHVQRVEPDKAAEAPKAPLSYTSADDPAEQSGVPAMAQVAAGETATAEPEAVAQKPVVKSEWEKTPRNAPCPCGSGKKYKACHGAA